MSEKVEYPATQSPDQSVSHPREIEKCIGQNTSVQEGHVEIEDQLDWNEGQSTFSVGPTRRNEGRRGKEVVGRDREKCRLLPSRRDTIVNFRYVLCLEQFISIFTVSSISIPD